MANKTSWKSVSGGANAGFRRAMWFARLRAAGLYDANCKRGVGACKTKTKPSATTLKQTKYANLSPKSKRQSKENPSRGAKAMSELIAQGKKKGNSTAAQRVALARSLRTQGKQRGATTSLTEESARTTNKAGKTVKTRYSAAVGVPISRERKIREATEGVTGRGKANPRFSPDRQLTNESIDRFARSRKQKVTTKKGGSKKSK